ncbi:hypothetical protein [Shimia sp.]|uniref:DUF6902 family protein n=1 Tax=Shimia sp. TaxID=1954381 RepID=UPI00356A132D
MTNIVSFDVASRRQTAEVRHAALMQCFARERRIPDDVFWLKENAELLNILECSGARLDAGALSAYQSFYDGVENRLRFFPQYYRFLLSICLDLEDLGMPGDKGQALVEWVAEQGFARAELSDLQRMEARRLMLRRGVDPLAEDGGLEERMRRFMARSATFSMPNKKAAYELTHAVFYLSEYGRRDPALDGDTRLSLEFAGLLAFLEQNADLLAEICIALRYGGFEVPEIWDTWLMRHSCRFAIESGARAPAADDYHEFLVCNWMLAVCGHHAFARPVKPGPTGFFRPEAGAGPLRELSECMFRLEDRSGDWQQMRPIVLGRLSEGAASQLCRAEHSTDRFGVFFQGFARSGSAMGAAG